MQRPRETLSVYCVNDYNAPTQLLFRVKNWNNHNVPLDKNGRTTRQANRKQAVVVTLPRVLAPQNRTPATAVAREFGKTVRGSCALRPLHRRSGQIVDAIDQMIKHVAVTSTGPLLAVLE